MKMMSNTSTTSTSGTTLISDMADGRAESPPASSPPLLLNENAIYCLAVAAEIPFRQILEFDREIFHARSHFFDSSSEHVVKDRSRNSGGKTDGGGDQRLRNARRDGAKLALPAFPRP